jgi:phosphohistidine phosphatase SixA
LSQHGKAAWHEKDRERKVSLTETFVNHGIEEWRLIVQEVKAHLEL